ncbi:Os05g0255800 [Oryza sativa Japonica Group]|uniref:Os05g0255800 protein n=1 Tax=Oryza sativa subsp. japonica TaxID=39947 RepID=Q60EF7_ORYSJ|nr:unknown protein [Oryza sativa Japonica Group]BAH93032.1 Os05g0255800 [Oryza sativa Japonica Group]|eukprot:NP_001174304.1 Os05g0255800 [Oryza sativa Japonica Group]
MRFPECLRQRRSDLIYVLRFQVLQASHLLPDLCPHFESAAIVRIFSTRKLHRISQKLSLGSVLYHLCPHHLRVHLQQQ